MTDVPVVSPSPPRPSRPRRGSRLHALLAGFIAICALFGLILVVDLFNSPSSDKLQPTAADTTSAHPRPAGVLPAGGGATSSITVKPSVHPTTDSSPSPKITSRPPDVAPVGPNSAVPTQRRVFAPIVILNNSQEKGLAEAARSRLEAAGFTVTRVGNYNSAYNVPVPTVFYDPEHKDAAQTLQDLIPDVKQATPKNDTKIVSGDPLILVITKDFPTTITQ